MIPTFVWLQLHPYHKFTVARQKNSKLVWSSSSCLSSGLSIREVTASCMRCLRLLLNENLETHQISIHCSHNSSMEEWRSSKSFSTPLPSLGNVAGSPIYVLPLSGFKYYILKGGRLTALRFIFNSLPTYFLPLLCISSDVAKKQ